MADAVGKLLDAVGNDVRPDDRTLLRVLGAIQPAAAAYAGAEGEVTAAPAAVAQAFIRWLTGLAARQPLAVHIRRAGEMDVISRRVMFFFMVWFLLMGVFENLAAKKPPCGSVIHRAALMSVRLRGRTSSFHQQHFRASQITLTLSA